MNTIFTLLIIILCLAILSFVAHQESEPHINDLNQRSNAEIDDCYSAWQAKTSAAWSSMTPAQRLQVGVAAINNCEGFGK